MSWPSIVTPGAAPASVSPVQLATVKTELGISGTAKDAKLTRLIGVVSALMAGGEGLDREFWRNTWTEQLAGRGGVLLPLARWPIETVTSIAWDGSTVTASEYEIAAGTRFSVYREDGWNLSAAADERRNHRKMLYTAVYIGGWWMPDQEPADWAATTAYTAGTFVKATAAPGLFYYECTTAGTSAGSEPTWPTTEGGTVTDGGAVWTARGGALLPADLQEAAMMQVIDFYRGGLLVPTGIDEESFDGARIRYAAAGATLTRAVRAICARYR